MNLGHKVHLTELIMSSRYFNCRKKINSVPDYYLTLFFKITVYSWSTHLGAVAMEKYLGRGQIKVLRREIKCIGAK